MDLGFSYKSKIFCCYVYVAILSSLLMNFVHVLHDGRYRCTVLLGLIPNPGHDLDVKVTEFSYKSQNVYLYVYIAISSRPFVEFHLYLA